MDGDRATTLPPGLDLAGDLAGIALGAIGQPMRRKEDQRLLTGKGKFSDDFSLPGQVYSAIVRSPHPHARIVSIDTAKATAMPGVLAVLTGADCAADGLGAVPEPFGSAACGGGSCEGGGSASDVAIGGRF